LLLLGLCPCPIVGGCGGGALILAADPQIQQLIGAMSNLMTETKNLHDAVQQTLKEQQAFSDATTQFATKLLKGLQIGFSQVHPDSSSSNDPPKLRNFSWAGGEANCTGKAMDKCREMLNLKITGVEFFDARSASLGVTGSTRLSSTGYLDVGIRSHNPCTASAFSFALGGIEFKTDKYKLKLAQMLLELTGMSILSTYGQGVANMGTDLIGKWMVLHFDEPNHIMVSHYASANDALKAFRELLYTCAKRGVEHGPSQLTTIPEHGSGGEGPGNDGDSDGYNGNNNNIQENDENNGSDESDGEDSASEQCDDHYGSEESDEHSGYNSQDLENLDELEGGRISVDEVKAMQKLRYLEGCAIALSDWSGDDVRVPYWASEQLHAEMRSAEMSAM
jgi:hypothetical protein